MTKLLQRLHDELVRRHYATTTRESVQGRDPWVRACGSQPLTVTCCAPESDGEKWDLAAQGRTSCG